MIGGAGDQDYLDEETMACEEIVKDMSREQ